MWPQETNMVSWLPSLSWSNFLYSLFGAGICNIVNLLCQIFEKVDFSAMSGASWVHVSLGNRYGILITFIIVNKSAIYCLRCTDLEHSESEWWKYLKNSTFSIFCSESTCTMSRYDPVELICYLNYYYYSEDICYRLFEVYTPGTYRTWRGQNLCSHL